MATLLIIGTAIVKSEDLQKVFVYPCGHISWTYINDWLRVGTMIINSPPKYYCSVCGVQHAGVSAASRGVYFLWQP